jgi:serine/threonine-protein kinase
MTSLLAARYELGAPLGAGGMARVVKAHDRVLHRDVAIKMIPRDVAEHADPALTARFVAEGRVAAGVTHRNLVTIYDAGDSDGFLYLVTEYVPGTNAAQLLESEGPLPVDRVVDISSQLLDALAAAHAAGIVHRDVKPANVLIDPEGTVKLADFGIAKRLDDLEAALTSHGEFVGTPRYVAPEQAAGERATPATDLYATGVLMYELLTGTPPYSGETPLATVLAHRDQPVPDIRAHRPGPVAAVIATAMSKRPDQRHASAAAMRDALADAADGRAAMAAALAGVPFAAGEPTLAVASPAATSAYPAGVTGAPLSHTEPNDGGRGIGPVWWLLAVAAVVIVAAIAIAAGSGDDGTPGGDTVAANSDTNLNRTATTPVRDTTGSTAPATGTPTTPLATAPATTQPEATQPATTLPATTVPATTQPPTTLPPPTTQPPLIDVDVLPDDLGELTGLVSADPSSFGGRGPDLQSALERLAESNGRGGTRKAAQDLIDDLDRWSANGEIDASVADHVREIVQPFAEGGGKGKEGDDDDGDD